MADNRQKRKRILSAHRPIVTVARLNVSLRIERNQTVNAFLFLILKGSFQSGPTTERAPGRWRRRRHLDLCENDC
jgi:hypothetical protein